MRTRMFAVGVIAVVLVASLSAQKSADKIPVFMFTQIDPSGFIDFDQVSRSTVVKDAAFRLSRSKLVRIVETKNEAVIVIEVGSYTVVKDKADSLAALSNSLNALAGGLASLKPRVDESHKATYRNSTLSIGDYSTELESEFGAALGERIEAFVKLNEEKLKATAVASGR
jgi:hypothetical protein